MPGELQPYETIFTAEYWGDPIMAETPMPNKGFVRDQDAAGRLLGETVVAVVRGTHSPEVLGDGIRLALGEDGGNTSYGSLGAVLLYDFERLHVSEGHPGLPSDDIPSDREIQSATLTTKNLSRLISSRMRYNTPTQPFSIAEVIRPSFTMISSPDGRARYQRLVNFAIVGETSRGLCLLNMNSAFTTSQGQVQTSVDRETGIRSLPRVIGETNARGSDSSYIYERLRRVELCRPGTPVRAKAPIQGRIRHFAHSH